MTLRIGSLAVVLFAAATTIVGCSSSRSGERGDDVLGEAGVPADGSRSDGGPALDASTDAAAASTGTLHGDVTRTAMPRAGGVGDLYIAVFDRDPVAEMDAAEVVASARIEDADLAAEDARVPYEVTGIPPRAEAYFVIAFLDDNGTVTDPATATPDRGDLISFEGFGAPTVEVSEPVRVEYEIVLNANLPF